MSTKQRVVLIAASVVVLGMVLFPPWLFVLDMPAHRSSTTRSEFGAGSSSSYGREHAERPAGYHSLFGQHVPADESESARLFSTDVSLRYVSMRIDRTRLEIQIGAVLLLNAILYFVLRRNAIAPSSD
jgi:hypothetical protein